jgi:hypothetical protein
VGQVSTAAWLTDRSGSWWVTLQCRCGGIEVSGRSTSASPTEAAHSNRSWRSAPASVRRNAGRHSTEHFTFWIPPRAPQLAHNNAAEDRGVLA